MLSLGTMKLSPPPHIASHHFRIAGGILEISANSLLHLVAAIHQPKHDKQRHHRGNKIGIHHLPRATMVPTMRGFLFDDDRSRRNVLTYSYAS
jgi:hypothetical protein